MPKDIGDLVRYMKHANRRDFIDAALLNIGEKKLWGLPALLQKKYADTLENTREYDDLYDGRTMI